jgi:ankyrin repeat protein
MNQIDPDGATALVLAIINANYDVAAALIEKGADPNIGDKEAKMAALYAAIDMHRLAIGHGRPNPKPSGRSRRGRRRQAAPRAPRRSERDAEGAALSAPAHRGDRARSARVRRRSCARRSRAMS